jgi:DNA polymerase V
MKIQLFSNDTIQSSLDLYKQLIQNPAATFFLKVGKHLIIVDQSLEPKHGDLVLAVIDGEFIVKKFSSAPREFEVRGVVTTFIRRFRH